MAATERNFMTEAEMYLIKGILFKCNDTLVLFDQRTNDKKILMVTQDEPTLVRYVIASPLMTDEQKEFAQSELDYLTENDPSVSAVQQTLFEDDDRVLYCAPNFGQE